MNIYTIFGLCVLSGIAITARAVDSDLTHRVRVSLALHGYPNVTLVEPSNNQKLYQTTMASQLVFDKGLYIGWADLGGNVTITSSGKLKRIDGSFMMVMPGVFEFISVIMFVFLLTNSLYRYRKSGKFKGDAIALSQGCVPSKTMRL